MARDLLAQPRKPRDLLAPQDGGQSQVMTDALAAGSQASQFFDREAPPPEPTLVDQIMGSVDWLDNTGAIVADRIGEGAMNVAGLPVDAVNALPMLFGRGPISNNPIGGSDWLNEARKGFGIVPDAPTPQDAVQTVLGRVGEEVGAAAVPGLGILGAAGRTTARAARESGNTFVRNFIAPAAANPTRFVATEAGGAAAAGTGAGIANLFADRDTTGGQIADMLGAFGGAGIYGAAGVVGRGLGQTFNALRQNPNYIDQTVKDAVVDRVGKAAGLPGSEMTNGVFDTDPLVDAIMSPSVSRPSEIIPGFQESLADVTANPGLASLEYARQSGPNAGMFTKQRGANNQAVDSVLRAIEPVETPGAFRSELEAQRDLRLAAAADQTSAAQSEFDSYIQNLQPRMLAEERGATIRAGLDNANRYAREMEDMAWADLDGQVETAPLADMIDETRGGLTVARQQATADLDATASIPRQLAAAGPVSIRELIDMRSTLLDEQRAALSGQQPDRNRAAVAGQMIDDINAYLDSDAVAPEVRAQFADARAVSRDVNETFNRPNDPIAQTLARSEGRPDLPDSAVGPRFVQPDNKQASNIDQLLAQTDLSSHGGSVREAVKDEILSGLDVTDPARMDTYLNQFTRAFDRFPDLRDEVTAAAGAGRAFDEASDAQAALTRDLGSPDGTQPGRGTVGRYLQYSDANSERAITEVLNAKDPGAVADELLSFVDDNPRAAEGARAAFWQKLKTESQSVDNSQRTMDGGRAWRGDWLKSFLDKPATAAVAERLYRDQPEALANIRAYADVLDNVDLRQRGKAVGTSGTAQGVNPVLTPETLQSRFYAYMRGQVSGTYLATSIAAVVARRAVRNAQTDAIERLTDQVLLNPQLAAELLKENNPANRASLSRKANVWRVNEVSTLLNLSDGEDPPIEEEQDDLVDTVMR